MRDGNQEYQAQSLSGADACGQLEEQVLVLHVSLGGSLVEQAMIGDGEAQRRAGVIGQTRAGLAAAVAASGVSPCSRTAR